MYSIVAVTALFVAIIFNDILQKQSSEISKHALFGLICILSIMLLWHNNLELVAWGLLIVPIVSLIFSFIILNINTPIHSTRIAPHSSSLLTKHTTSSCAPVPLTPPPTSCAPATVSLPACAPANTKSLITPITGC